MEKFAAGMGWGWGRTSRGWGGGWGPTSRGWGGVGYELRQRGAGMESTLDPVSLSSLNICFQDLTYDTILTMKLKLTID